MIFWFYLSNKLQNNLKFKNTLFEENKISFLNINKLQIIRFSLSRLNYSKKNSLFENSKKSIDYYYYFNYYRLFITYFLKHYN